MDNADSPLMPVEPNEHGIEIFHQYEWGYPVTRLYGNPELFAQVGQFRAAVRLIPADATPARIELADATVRNIVAGDSNFSVDPSDTDFGIVVADGSRIDVRCHLNQHGRIGGFEVLPFGAPNLREANQMVQLMLERLVIRYAVACGIAFRWDVIITEDISAPNRTRASPSSIWPPNCTCATSPPVITTNRCTSRRNLRRPHARAR